MHIHLATLQDVCVFIYSYIVQVSFHYYYYYYFPSFFYYYYFFYFMFNI